MTGLTAVLLLGGGVGIAVAVATSPSSPSGAPRGHVAVPAAQLTAYQAAIVPILQTAGGMVEQEIKPAIASLESGSLTAAEMRARAVAWEGRFARARAALGRVAAPAGMATAAAGFDQAFQRYGQAVAALAGVPDAANGDPNPVQVQSAAALAAQADKLYDGAAAIIQAERRADGLGPTADLPDPTPSPAD